MSLITLIEDDNTYQFSKYIDLVKVWNCLIFRQIMIKFYLKNLLMVYMIQNLYFKMKNRKKS